MYEQQPGKVHFPAFVVVPFTPARVIDWNTALAPAASRPLMCACMRLL